MFATVIVLAAIFAPVTLAFTIEASTTALAASSSAPTASSAKCSFNILPFGIFAAVTELAANSPELIAPAAIIPVSTAWEAIVIAPFAASVASPDIATLSQLLVPS